MRHGGAEGAVFFGHLRVDMDPLMIAGHIRKRIDPDLVDLLGLRRAEIVADEIFHRGAGIAIRCRHYWFPPITIGAVRVSKFYPH